MRSRTSPCPGVVSVSPVLVSLSPMTAKIWPAPRAGTRRFCDACMSSTRETRSFRPWLAFQTSSPSAMRPE